MSQPMPARTTPPPPPPPLPITDPTVAPITGAGPATGFGQQRKPQQERGVSLV